MQCSPNPNLTCRRPGRPWAACLLALFGLACTSATTPPSRVPLWNDPDRHAFPGPPDAYYSGHITNRMDFLFVRPVTQFLAVAPAGEARNINTLDEVPDSSWFTNRIGRYPMSPEQVAAGPCTTPPLDETDTWTVTSSKPNGGTPGFVITGSDARRYLLKFDSPTEVPRATAADAIVSRIYYAAGYSTPCNRVVVFSRDQLAVAPDAKETDGLGHKRRYTEADLDHSLSRTARTRDGRYRAMASLWLEGKPTGPWRFEGTRSDDPNDIVAHEDRRELRGMRLLAAWTGHMDQREQNTLGTFQEVSPGRGWIRHNLLDFGDCLGIVEEPPEFGRRVAGHTYSLDVGQMLVDWLSFGIAERPWENERFGPSGPVFGYFNVENFDPERWVPSYPNPAFERMSERDAAWMARIIARFDQRRLERIVRTGRIGTPLLHTELMRILMGRRHRILERYLTRVSSLGLPTVKQKSSLTSLCADELAVNAGLLAPSQAHYRGRLLIKGHWFPSPVQASDGEACMVLRGARSADDKSAESLIAELRTTAARLSGQGPLVVHLQVRDGGYRVTRVERPDR